MTAMTEKIDPMQGIEDALGKTQNDKDDRPLRRLIARMELLARCDDLISGERYVMSEARTQQLSRTMDFVQADSEHLLDLFLERMGRTPRRPGGDQAMLFDERDPDHVDDEPADVKKLETLRSMLAQAHELDSNDLIQQLTAKVQSHEGKMASRRARQANKSTTTYGQNDELAVYCHSGQNAWAIRLMKPETKWICTFRQDKGGFLVDRNGHAPKAEDRANYVARSLARLIDNGILIIGELAHDEAADTTGDH